MRSPFTFSLGIFFTTLFCLNLTSTIEAAPQVKVQGRQIVADFDNDGNYEPFVVKGVGYSPMPIGRHVSDWGYPDPNDTRPDNIFDDPAILDRDFSLLQSMNANTIRIWKGDNTRSGNRFPNHLTQRTFDKAEQYGLKIIPGFWIENEGYGFCGPNGYGYNVTTDYTNPNVRSDILNRFSAFVSQFKDHPALLFWAIGNENNLFLSGDTTRMQAFYSLIDQMAQLAHSIEGSDYHPVAYVHGDLLHLGDVNAGSTDAQMPNLDIWGANVYRGSSFTNFFSSYKALSTKPVWISEFGVDAWHTNDVKNPDDGYDDPQTQATYAGNLWDEIVANNDVAIGGTIMAYSDEWWKPHEWYCDNDGNPGTNSSICNNQQNPFGFGPIDTNCDGQDDFIPSFPDKMFNEEYFGIMSIAKNPQLYQPDIMTPRPIYNVLQTKFGAGTPPPPQPTSWSDITWTDIINVNVNGNTITKNRANRWGNSGAASAEIIQTDGAVRFTIQETTTARMLGLSNVNTNAHFKTIGYAIYVHGNNGYGVWENGVNKWNLTGYQSGDVFMVERQGNTIKYFKNGDVFYTSSSQSTGQLVVDGAIFHRNGTIANVQIKGSAAPTVTVPQAVNDLNASNLDSGVDLTWTAPADGGASIIGYQIEYGTVNSGLFDNIIQDDIVPSATITGLINDTTYQFRILAINSEGTSPPSNTVQTTPTQVIGINWTDLLGVTVSDNTITKTAFNSWGNAGAASMDQIIADGSVSFTIQETSTSRMIGLSNKNTNAHYNTIAYALYVHGNNGFGVWENGVNKWNLTGYQSGDVFTVKRVGSTITYLKNNNIFYTSQVANSGSLIVDMAIYHQNGTIANIQLQGSSAPVLTIPSAISDLSATAQDGGVDLSWSEPTNGGSAITSYRIEYGTVNPNQFNTTLVDDATPGVSINGLANGTAYQFRVIASNAQGDSIASNIVQTTPAQRVGLNWTDLVGATVSGNTITKTAFNSWGNAGAASTQSINGDGSVSFTIQETNTARMVGLSNSNANAHYNTIDYTIYVHGFNGYGVWENGVNKWNLTGYQSGDVFTVKRVGSTISYLKNGVVFYTSLTPSSGAMIVDSAIYHQGGTITNVVIQ